ncbi:MAG: hypothetical protein QOE32_1268, partial [Pseudonocardiales bacterium]|nr:hypothetical protein [Pseudonocardiales bacterium]
MGRHGRERRPATEAPSRSWPTTEPDDALTAPQAPVTRQNPSAGHDHGHGHGHGHGPAAPASRRVRILLAVFLVPCAIASVVGV